MNVGWSAAEDEQREPRNSKLWLEKGDSGVALYLMDSNSNVVMVLRSYPSIN